MDVIRELLATRAAIGKLGARGISIEAAQQLLDNRYVILPNLAIAGHTDGCRLAGC